MRPDGLGSLYAQFEERKARLAREGLFDAGKKRPLPLVPRGIAIVTSPTGAVLHDIRTVSARRNPAIPLTLLPVRVQGDGAAEEIAAAIRQAGKLPGIDVIITGRGGGSLEDLWAFNEECVVRAIAESPVPVISAVGHETDVTLADFAADARAATPSMAAELAVQDRAELLARLEALRRQLGQLFLQQVLLRQQLLGTLRTRLTACHPVQRLAAQEHALATLKAGIRTAMLRRMGEAAADVARQKAKLEALGPMAVLGRGYALVMRGRSPVTSAQAASKAQSLTLRFYDGAVGVRVEREKEHGGQEEGNL